MQVGFAAYCKTCWFGRRQHSGATYASEITIVVGDGDEHIACCADNTSSNTSMQNGLFGILSTTYDCFFSRVLCPLHGPLIGRRGEAP